MEEEQLIGTRTEISAYADRCHESYDRIMLYIGSSEESDRIPRSLAKEAREIHRLRKILHSLIDRVHDAEKQSNSELKPYFDSCWKHILRGQHWIIRASGALSNEFQDFSEDSSEEIKVGLSQY